MSVAPLHVQERTFTISLPWVVGRMALWVAAFSAGCLLVLPKGLSLFACALMAATGPALIGILRRNRPPLPASIRWLAATAAIVLVTAGVSVLSSGAGWQALDNPARIVLLPWCAWLAWVYRLSASSLAWGAVIGLGVACVVSVAEAIQGVGRAGGGINPIVFANAVLALLVIAVFCRPLRSTFAMRCLLVLLFAVAAVTITLSGSRGVLPGLALVVVVLSAGDHGWHWKKAASAAVILLLASVLVWNVPWLSSKFRLDDVQAEVERYAVGDVDTPVGARLALWAVAWQSFRQAPVSGVGIDGFESRIDASAHCQSGPRHFCDLGHAHNDLAQWAAAMGIPGIVALFALYTVPLFLAVRRLRDPPMHGRTAARACAVLVGVYITSGLTQSMFAHALSISAYVIFAGLLLGICSAQTGSAARTVPQQ